MKIQPHYLVKVREHGAAAAAPWRSLSPIPAVGTDLQIPDLEMGKTFDFRITYVDEDGDESAEELLEGHTVAGLELQPPNVSDVEVLGGCLKWRGPVDPQQVRGFLIRYAIGEQEDLALMLPAHDGVWPAPPFPLCSIPQGIVTFAVTALSVAGVESVTPAFRTVDRGPLDAREAVTKWEQDHAALGWPGTKVNGSVSGGAVVGQLDPDELYGPERLELYGDYDHSVEYGPDGDDDLYGPDVTDGRLYGPDDPAAEYGAPEYLDLMYGARVHVPPTEAPGRVLTVHAAIVGPSFRLEYRRTTQLYGPAVSGAYGADAEDETGVPYGPGEGATWRPWPGRLEAAGGGLFEFRVVAPGGTVQPKVTAFKVALSAAA